MPNNIFRQAQALLRDKPVSEMTEDELHLINAATIPLTLLKMFNDITILDGLEKLAEIVEGAE